MCLLRFDTYQTRQVPFEAKGCLNLSRTHQQTRASRCAAHVEVDPASLRAGAIFDIAAEPAGEKQWS
jgi:hypothetical protein